MKVAFCTPTTKQPFGPMLDSLGASVPLVVGAGWEDGTVFEIGNPYISFARASLAKKALDWGADVIVFIDHDVSWKPGDMLKLLETEGDVVAGTYRFKKDGAPEYMGSLITDDADRPIVRADGCVKAATAPAGFLKVTRRVFEKLAIAYPELIFGSDETAGHYVDLFNHGAHKGAWWGEDYAFSRRWIDAGGEVWIIPDLDIGHHGPDGSVWPGNFHKFLLAQPGGSEAQEIAA